MTRWAVFDVDGTLLPSSSMEKMFILHMLSNCALPISNIFSYFLAGLVRMAAEKPEDAFKKNKYYLKDLPLSVIAKEARRFVRKQVIPGLSAAGLQTMKALREEGFRIMVMSGSPDFLTLPLCRFLEPDAVITAKMSIKESRFTGQIDNLHPYGKRKTLLLLQAQKIWKIDFPDSIVFANHDADIDHMLLFGEAVAVNPTKKLREFALQKKWRIEIWE